MSPRAARCAKKLMQFIPNAALVKINFLNTSLMSHLNEKSYTSIKKKAFAFFKIYILINIESAQTNFAERFDEIGVVQNFLE